MSTNGNIGLQQRLEIMEAQAARDHVQWELQQKHPGEHVVYRESWQCSGSTPQLNYHVVFHTSDHGAFLNWLQAHSVDEPDENLRITYFSPADTFESPFIALHS